MEAEISVKPLPFIGMIIMIIGVVIMMIKPNKKLSTVLMLRGAFLFILGIFTGGYIKDL